MKNKRRLPFKHYLEIFISKLISLRLESEWIFNDKLDGKSYRVGRIDLEEIKKDPSRFFGEDLYTHILDIGKQLEDIIEELKSLKQEYLHREPETDFIGSCLDSLIDWNGGFSFELDNEDKGDLKLTNLYFHSTVETYLKEKYDSLVQIHGFIIKDRLSMNFDYNSLKNIEVKEGVRNAITTLRDLFKDAARNYPGISHQFMTWPFLRLMPRPPKDSTAAFIKKRMKVTPYMPYLLFNEVSPFISKEVLVTDWFMPDQESAGRSCFAELAYEAGKHLYSILHGGEDYAHVPYVNTSPTSIWVYAIHHREKNILNKKMIDSWDGLFDNDSDFDDDGFRKGLYSFSWVEDVFLDSVFLCDEILNNATIKGHNGRIDQSNNKPDTVILSPSFEKAYQSYMEAIRSNPSLDEKSTDEEVYQYVCEELDTYDYKPPPFKTWQRYVRKGRNYYGTQKNKPRKNRPHGKSIVKSNEI